MTEIPPASIPPASIPPASIEALTELVGRFAAEHHCPSISWGLVTDGQLTTTGASWDDEHMTMPTADTVYRIASMTKSFTCAALLALRDDGVLSLDDPLTMHAPELAALRPATSDTGPIRIRHLMRMSSGLATDDAWADRHLEISDDDLDAAVATAGSSPAPRGRSWSSRSWGSDCSAEWCCAPPAEPYRT